MPRKYKTYRANVPLPFKAVFLISLILFTFLTVVGIWVVNSKIKPTLVHYANAQTKKIATLVISDAIKDEVANVSDINEIMSTDESSDTIQFDAQKINEILANTTEAITENLHDIEVGDLKKIENETGTKLGKDSRNIQLYIPIGLATKNALLAKFGPDVPISFTAVGDVETDIKPEVEQFGINSALIKVALVAKVHVRMIEPFSSDEAEVVTNVPLAMGVVKGQVPTLVSGSLPGLNLQQQSPKSEKQD